MQKSPIAAFTIAFITAGLLPDAAHAQKYKALAGSYHLGGKDFYDPPADQPQNTHIYFEITGAAAADLYANLRMKPVSAACGEPGTKTKRAGEIQCTQNTKPRSHRCWFGVNLATQELVNGVVC
jgi:hypothetical protein